MKCLLIPLSGESLCTVELTFKFGSNYETRGGAHIYETRGGAHIVEHMMFRSNVIKKKYVKPVDLYKMLGKNGIPLNNEDVDTISRRVGSVYNATTSCSRTCYYHRIYYKQIESILLIFANILKGHRVDADELNKEKEVIVDELKMRMRDDMYRAYEQILKMQFLEDEMESYPTIGTCRSIYDMDCNVLNKFILKNYIAENAILSITGSFDGEYVVNLVNKIFENVLGIDIEYELVDVNIYLQNVKITCEDYFEHYSKKMIGYGYKLRYDEMFENRSVTTCFRSYRLPVVYNPFFSTLITMYLSGSIGNKFQEYISKNSKLSTISISFDDYRSGTLLNVVVKYDNQYQEYFETGFNKIFFDYLDEKMLQDDVRNQEYFHMLKNKLSDDYLLMLSNSDKTSEFFSRIYTIYKISEYDPGQLINKIKLEDIINYLKLIMSSREATYYSIGTMKPLRIQKYEDTYEKCEDTSGLTLDVPSTLQTREPMAYYFMPLVCKLSEYDEKNDYIDVKMVGEGTKRLYVAKRGYHYYKKCLMFYDDVFEKDDVGTIDEVSNKMMLECIMESVFYKKFVEMCLTKYKVYVSGLSVRGMKESCVDVCYGLLKELLQQNVRSINSDTYSYVLSMYLLEYQNMEEVCGIDYGLHLMYQLLVVDARNRWGFNSLTLNDEKIFRTSATKYLSNLDYHQLTREWMKKFREDNLLLCASTPDSDKNSDKNSDVDRSKKRCRIDLGYDVGLHSQNKVVEPSVNLTIDRKQCNSIVFLGRCGHIDKRDRFQYYILRPLFQIIAFGSLGSRLYRLRVDDALFYSSSGIIGKGATRHHGGIDVLVFKLKKKNIEKTLKRVKETILSEDYWKQNPITAMELDSAKCVLMNEYYHHISEEFVLESILDRGYFDTNFRMDLEIVSLETLSNFVENLCVHEYTNVIKFI